VPPGLRLRVGLRTAVLVAALASPVAGMPRLPLIGFAPFGAAPVAATTILAMPFAEQCTGAETIVVGTVRAVASRRSPRAPEFFETLVTLGVDQVVAGSPGAELTLRLAGGEVGAIRQSIDGMPEFQVGQRYVVFLDREQDPPAISPVRGFNQGLYRVERLDGGDVVRDGSGRALTSEAVAALGPAAVRRESGVGTGGAPSLDAFVAAIHAARP